MRPRLDSTRTLVERYRDPAGADLLGEAWEDELPYYRFDQPSQCSEL